MDNIAIILSSSLGAIGAYYISINLKKGAVFGSSTVVLLSGIFFPHFFGDLGKTMAIVATCGSYAGMVNAKNVPNIFHMLAIGAINGIIFIVALPSYQGVGGKLGTIAAISCISWLGARELYKKIFLGERLHQNEKP